MKQKDDVISTSRRVFLRHKALSKTQNNSLGVGEEIGTGGKETKHRRQVGEVGGKDSI